MPKIELDALHSTTGSSYPDIYAAQMDGRSVKRLAEPSGLTQFGANLVTLAPGAKSSLRHWHAQQDEFVMVISGHLTLIDDHGTTELRAGDCAAFPAGDPNGHHLVNGADTMGSFLVIGTHTPRETGHYSDIDMKVTIAHGTCSFTTKSGQIIE